MLERLLELTQRARSALFNPHHVAGADGDLIRRVKREKLTYLSDAKLAELARTCRAIEEHSVPGDFVEAGCALGGSAILISLLKSPQRPFHVHDVFGMIPRPTAEDTEDVHERYRTIATGQARGIGGDEYYGYTENLFEKVQANLQRFGVDCASRNVHLVKGLVQETLHPSAAIALAHIDVDWYDPVKTCLERLFPRLSPGGSVILDDYHDWGGCRKATDEYLATIADQVKLDDSARSLKITRIAPERRA